MSEKYAIFFGGTTESGKFSRDLFIFDFGELNAPFIIDFKVGLNREKKNINISETRSFSLVEFAAEDAPYARHFHSSFFYQQELYIFGGKSNGYHNDLRKFNLESKKWTHIKVSAAPLARYGQTCQVFENELYLYGGYDQHGFPSKDLHKFNFEKCTWTKVKVSREVPNLERFHHSCAVFNRSMFVFGGRSEKDSYSDLLEFHFGELSFHILNKFIFI